MRFKNKALLSLYLLLLAQLVNDWWSITLGYPTPTQLVLTGSIVFLPWKRNKEKEFRLLCFCLLTYLTIIILSYYFVMIVPIPETRFFVISISINIIYMLRIFQNIKKDSICEKDLLEFSRLVIYTILFIAIIPGFYELITHQKILHTNKGLSEDVFYIRGLFIDKVDFGSYLSFGSFIALGVLLTKKTKKTIKAVSLIVILSSLILISFSFSTTSIIGFGCGLVIIAALIPGKKPIHFITIGLFSVLIISIAIRSDIATKQLMAYNLKYKLEIENYQTKNERYRMFITGMNTFIESPLWGHGVGRAAFIFEEKLNYSKPLNAHNFLANELVDNGLFGTMPLAIFFVFIIVLSYRALKLNGLLLDSNIFNFSCIGIGFSVFILIRVMLYYQQFENTVYIEWAGVILSIFKYYMHIYKIKKQGINKLESKAKLNGSRI